MISVWRPGRWCVAIVVGLVLSLLACADDAPPEAPPTPVRIQSVEALAGGEGGHYSASLEPRESPPRMTRSSSNRREGGREGRADERRPDRSSAVKPRGVPRIALSWPPSRGAVSALGTEGECLLGWRAGDAVLGDLG